MDYCLVYHCCENQRKIGYSWGDAQKEVPICPVCGEEMVRGWLPLTPERVNTAMVNIFASHVKCGNITAAKDALIVAAVSAIRSQNADVIEKFTSANVSLEKIENGCS